ncbi:MAG: CotH kinase family protein [Lachnospiraceae bacterium]
MKKEWVRKIVSIGILALLAGAVFFCAYFYRYYEGQPEEITENNAVTIEAQAEEESIEPEENPESEGNNNYDFEGFLDIYAVIDGGTGARSHKLYIQQDTCCFFLPSYAMEGHVTWQFDEETYEITVDGKKITGGDRLEMPEEEQLITVRQAESGQAVEYKLKVMQSECIPAVYVDTDSHSMQYLEQDKEHEEMGQFQCITDTGEVDSEGGLDKISGRGYSSFSAGKKSYTITFENPQDVMQMGSAGKWVLQANAYDLSRMRNKTVYDMAKNMGVPYAVDSAYVDVYFNGEYAGNYLLCEKIEVAPNRVDIGDAYLLEGIFAGRSEEDISFIQGKAGWYEVKNPKEVTEEDLAFLQTYMDDIVEMIEECDTEEEYKQLQQYIDIDSFAQMYILDELTNEPDLNRASTFYFIMDEGEGRKLYAGPVWDYDRSLGNVEGARYEYLTCLSPGLGEKLFACAYFRQDVTERFVSLYEPVITQYLDEIVRRYYETICASVRMDEIRWGSSKNNSYTKFNAEYTTFEDAVKYMTYYLNTRYQLIRGYLYEPEQYHQVEFVNTGSRLEYDSRRYWVRDGEKIPDEVLTYLRQIFECDGWSFVDGRDCQVNRPILGDMKLYSYAEEKQAEETQEEVTTQESESSGYSKRFVLMCIAVAACGAGMCGIAIGWSVQIIRCRKKEKNREN